MNNKKAKGNTRTIFINKIGYVIFMNTKINNAILEDLYFDCELDQQFLQELENTYIKNEKTLYKFLSLQKDLYILDKMLIIATCCELLITSFHKTTIKQYLQKSDQLGGTTSKIHAILNNFKAFYEQE